jgi:hypothetical protein
MKLRNIKSRIWQLILGVWVMALVISPKPATAQSVTIDDLHPFYRVDLSGVWPKHDIDLCWEGSAARYINEKIWIQESVVQFIEGNSAYRFSGWQTTCDFSTAHRIRISVVDAIPITEVGYNPRGGNGPTHVGLNVVFSAWGQPCASLKSWPDPAESKTVREHCIRTIAVHEFMHALGALHEQLDPDLEQKDPDCFKVYTPSFICNFDPAQCGVSPTALTTYDHDSIMNYCRNGASGNYYDLPLKLSDRDKIGLRMLSDLTAQTENRR